MSRSRPCCGTEMAARSSRSWCVVAGVTAHTLCRWKRKYGGMQTGDTKRLKALEEENRQLKRLVADQALNLRGVRDLLQKAVTPAHRRAAVTYAMEIAALLGATSMSLYRLRTLESALSHAPSIAVGTPRPVADACGASPALGLSSIVSHAATRGPRRESQARAACVSGKRARGATAPAKAHRPPRAPMPMLTQRNERWSMIFRRCVVRWAEVRALTIVDDFTRESPTIELGTPLPGERVVWVPRQARVDARRLARARLCATTDWNFAARHSISGRIGAVSRCSSSAGQAGIERLRRELQWPSGRRMP